MPSSCDCHKLLVLQTSGVEIVEALLLAACLQWYCLTTKYWCCTCTGPTNSGKTYNALQSLAAVERGVYCAPLRLLAMEVYETLNHRGVYCDLVGHRQ